MATLDYAPLKIHQILELKEPTHVETQGIPRAITYNEECSLNNRICCGYLQGDCNLLYFTLDPAEKRKIILVNRVILLRASQESEIPITLRGEVIPGEVTHLKVHRLSLEGTTLEV